MHKTLKYTFLFLFLLIGNISKAQIVHIPDAFFKQDLINKGVDKNNDQEISFEETIEITNLKIGGASSQILDLSGLEAFTELKSLEVNVVGIKELDMNNTKIEDLQLDVDSLTELNISLLENLDQLVITKSLIDTLKTSSNTKLKQVFLNTNPQLKAILFPEENQIEELTVWDAHSTYNLFDFGSLNLLKKLDFSVGRQRGLMDWSSLTLPTSGQLKSLILFNVHGIDTLFIPRYVEEVEYFSDSIPMQLMQDTQVKSITAFSLGAKVLGLEQAAKLEELIITGGINDSLDLKNSPLLKTLSHDSGLKHLDVSQNLSLASISINNSLLDSMDLSNNLMLSDINLSDNAFLSKVCFWQVPIYGNITLNTPGSPNASLEVCYPISTKLISPMPQCPNEELEFVSSGDVSYWWSEIDNPEEVLSEGGDTTILAPLVNGRYVIHGQKGGTDTVDVLVKEAFTPRVDFDYLGKGNTCGELVYAAKDTFMAGETPLYTLYVNGVPRESSSNGSIKTKEVSYGDTVLFNMQSSSKECLLANQVFSDSKLSFFTAEEACVKVYELITPNGDGKNDFFVVDNLSKFPGSLVSIYNSWGEKVYETINYKNNWNGHQLKNGSYFYTIIVLPINQVLRGRVLLTR